ncbi:hypothetical protein [Actinomadura hibisca]|uniref:hypothetical protein n=1 Tax=Actinomadura hibisca TaxID=68565 RepID=UPI00083339FF|nr:hypothetical protein [Actinomadura hibisca]
MGFPFEYFRAPDAAEALRLLDDPEDPGVPAAPTMRGADAVEAKGMDSTVTVGQLLAFILEVPWDVDLMSSELVWPQSPPASEREAEELPDDSPWNTGVTVEVLGDAARDGLAGADEARFPELAERWAGIEEFGRDTDPGELVEIITELVTLARRAKQNGEHLFTWCCV